MFKVECCYVVLILPEGRNFAVFGRFSAR